MTSGTPSNRAPTPRSRSFRRRRRSAARRCRCVERGRCFCRPTGPHARAPTRRTRGSGQAPDSSRRVAAIQTLNVRDRAVHHLFGSCVERECELRGTPPRSNRFAKPVNARTSTSSSSSASSRFAACSRTSSPMPAAAPRGPASSRWRRMVERAMSRVMRTELSKQLDVLGAKLFEHVPPGGGVARRFRKGDAPSQQSPACIEAITPRR